ncbi:hypothetical protein NPX13_g5086 [Xylaria arbuscula]|uniref:Uncharacterized protein n=1 Tax=Xylaria arbuscula TaxID=114810 RepID=A0A9W8TN11_9PEZI|nr:hypothetical protein NPX13_g5086 [Xylaria arbuscula]
MIGLLHWAPTAEQALPGHFELYTSDKRRHPATGKSVPFGADDTNGLVSTVPSTSFGPVTDKNNRWLRSTLRSRCNRLDQWGYLSTKLELGASSRYVDYHTTHVLVRGFCD